LKARRFISGLSNLDLKIDMNELKQWIISIIIAGTISVGVWILLIINQSSEKNTSVLAVNDLRILTTESNFQAISLEEKSQHLVSIEIPQIEVNAQIEYVEKDFEGRMAVPLDYNNVGWYSPGTFPGENGQAVMAGHIDSETGPAVFSKLSTLKIGDQIRVRISTGEIIYFEVYDIKNFSDKDFPIKAVFGATEFAGLNLITCTGTFDESTKNYSNRIVVFTKKIAQSANNSTGQ
jgi:LPXTG-site transpeptidase (sortase) family protein